MSKLALYRLVHPTDKQFYFCGLLSDDKVAVTHYAYTYSYNRSTAASTVVRFTLGSGQVLSFCHDERMEISSQDAREFWEILVSRYGYNRRPLPSEVV